MRIVSDVNLYLSLAGGEPVDLVIERDGVPLRRDQLELVPRTYVENGETGTYFGLYFEQAPATPERKLQQSWETTRYFARSVWLGFQMLAEGKAGMGDLSGPVGIVSLIGQSGAQADSVGDGLRAVVSIIALVAVNLAVVNMLPIPALDGGHVLFNLIELVFRRPVPQKIQNTCVYAGFILLITFMLMATVFDVKRLIS